MCMCFVSWFREDLQCTDLNTEYEAAGYVTVPIKLYDVSMCNCQAKERSAFLAASLSDIFCFPDHAQVSVHHSISRKATCLQKWLRCLFSSVYLVFRTKLHCQQNVWKRWLERWRRKEADATQWIGLALFALSDFVAKCCRGVKDGVKARLMHRLLFSTPSKCYRCQHAESSQLYLPWLPAIPTCLEWAVAKFCSVDGPCWLMWGCSCFTSVHFIFAVTFLASVWLCASCWQIHHLSEEKFLTQKLPISSLKRLLRLAASSLLCLCEH